MGAKTNPGTITVLASAARTATVNSDPFRVGGRYRGVVVQVDVTAVTSTPSTTFTVQASVDGVTWTTHLASAAIATTGTRNYVCHPDAADTANTSENSAFPAIWRVACTHGNANSMTYSIKAWALG